MASTYSTSKYDASSGRCGGECKDFSLIPFKADHLAHVKIIKRNNPNALTYQCIQRPNVMYGSIFWDFLHRVALINRFTSLSDQIRKAMDVMDSVMSLFPCSLCRNAYFEYARCRKSPDVYTAVTDANGCVIPNLKLFEWTWKIHNHVNSKLGKKVVSFECALSGFMATEMNHRS